MRQKINVIVWFTIVVSYVTSCTGFYLTNKLSPRSKRNTNDCTYSADLCVSRLCGLQLQGCTNKFDSTAVIQYNTCAAPEIQNGFFTVTEKKEKKYVPGGPIPHNAHVNISCNENYVLNTQISLLACVHGVWSSDIPECLVFCPPLPASSELEAVQCFKNDVPVNCNQPFYDAVVITEYKQTNSSTNTTLAASICSAGSWITLFSHTNAVRCPPRVQSESVEVVCTLEGELVECNNAPERSKAVSHCRHYYQPRPGEPLSSTATCLYGSWDNPPIHCQPECGMAVEGAPEGKRFPWAVGLYWLNDAYGEYQYVHGATIIAPDVVISSAHHFAGRNAIPDSSFYIAAGKYYRDYNKTEEFAQKRQVKEIHIHPKYIDIEGNIAVLILKKPLEMTTLVRPVCVDWDGTVQRQNNNPYAYGIVEGWGTTTRNGRNSEELIAFNVPQVDRDTCLKNIPTHIRQIITKERFCAGLINGTSLCDGFEGNGFALKWKVLKEERYYLYGVGNAIVGEDSVCGDYYNLYTKLLSRYTSFVEEIIKQNQKVRCPARLSNSAEVRCTLAGNFVDCTLPMREGTVAVSRCRPYYNSTSPLVFSESRCSQGAWDQPLLPCRSTDPLVHECGESALEGQPFSVNSFDAEYGKFPWHVGIYRLENNIYNYQCGGSIIRAAIILSAAHCFIRYDGEKLPAGEFFVGAGKYFRDFNTTKDTMAQIQQVKQYYVPEKYLGITGSFGHDIAVVIVQNPFDFTALVKPVCIGLDMKIEKEQLQLNHSGTVVGWGSTNPYDPNKLSDTLKQVSLPYINTATCLEKVPHSFKRWILEDKYCAGYTNGTSVCVGDSGGGMVFKWSDNNTNRYFIRGIVSLGHKDGILVCDNTIYTLFTKISNHFDFILEVIRQNL